MGLKDLMDKYGEIPVNKENWLRLRQYDKEQGQEYDAEGYKLEDGVTIIYDYKSGSWTDGTDRVYKEILVDGEIVGFKIKPQDRQE